MSQNPPENLPEVASHGLFGIRPKVGDVWTIKRKGRKITKEIGRIYRTRFSRGSGENETQPLLVYVEWKRLPKGRYSGIRAKWLMKNGTRISTKAERDAAFEKRMAALGIPNDSILPPAERGATEARK